MKSLHTALAVIALVAATSTAVAQSVNASLTAFCTGKPGSQIAMRWAHPTYNSTSYIAPNIFTVKCDTGQKTQNLLVTNFSSQIEIQTEGGDVTGYLFTAKIAGTDGKANSITISHSPGDQILVLGSGFAVHNTAGPNKYGEQRLHVDMTSVPHTAVTRAHVSGDGDAQLALRWGHPSHDTHEYFKLFKWKPNSPEDGPVFKLTDAASTFELQTEGGEKTSYQLEIWLTSSPPHGPDLIVMHDLTPDRVTIVNPSANFMPTSGNVYGERDITVQVPGLPMTP